jgi:hypothetical protein
VSARDAIDMLSDAVQQAITQITAARDAAIQTIDDAFVERLTIKGGPLTPEMQTRLAALRTARSVPQPIIVDSEDQAVSLFHDDPLAPRYGMRRQPAEVAAVVEARTLELYAERRAARGDRPPSGMSAQIKAAIQAIVELIAKGDR